MKHAGFLLALLVSVSLVSASHASGQTRQQTAQKASPLTSGFKGLGFIDYSYIAKSPVRALEGENAFSVRKLDLGYEHNFTRNVLVFSELEWNDQAVPTNAVFIRQAFVELKNVLPQMRMVMGLSPTPAVVTSERIWGYRVLSPMPLEQYGLAPVIDNGIALKGKIDPDGIVSYHVMVANGTGMLGETDKTKRLYASMGFAMGSGFTLEGYGDFENAGNERYRATMRGLLGWEGTSSSIGLEGIYRINHHTVAPWYDQSPYAVALYGWVEAGDDLRFVYRGDFYDPDQNEMHLGVQMIQAMAGFDYMPVNDVHIIPNAVYATYQNKNEAAADPSDALTIRLSAAFYFSSIK